VVLFRRNTTAMMSFDAMQVLVRDRQRTLRQQAARHHLGQQRHPSAVRVRTGRILVRAGRRLATGTTGL
jgi:hypothetical protein